VKTTAIGASEPLSESPSAPHPHEVVPSALPALSHGVGGSMESVRIDSHEPVERPSLEQVREGPTLVRRLALARDVLRDAEGWRVDQIRDLIASFPQDWVQRRILAHLLMRGIPADLTQAVDLVGGLKTRASRRWCVSILSHEWPLSDAERRALHELI